MPGHLVQATLVSLQYCGKICSDTLCGVHVSLLSGSTHQFKFKVMMLICFTHSILTFMPASVLSSFQVFKRIQVETVEVVSTLVASGFYLCFLQVMWFSWFHKLSSRSEI